MTYVEMSTVEKLTLVASLQNMRRDMVIESGKRKTLKKAKKKKEITFASDELKKAFAQMSPECQKLLL